MALASTTLPTKSGLSLWCSSSPSLARRFPAHFSPIGSRIASRSFATASFANRERKQGSCEKKKLGSLHPIPRPQKETKKLKPLVPSGNEFGDCIFIDVEEEKHEATLDQQPMPMALEEPYIESVPMEKIMLSTLQFNISLPM